MLSRNVDKVILSVEQGEGVGARVRRSIGRPELKNFDPFLLLDEFKVDKGAGFTTHPHRGFETVTFMLSGKFTHEDFCGHRGDIGPGDLQWMTAGRGIVHAEMPASEEQSHGLQLWVNLAAVDKMTEPKYQELRKEEIPRATKDGVSAVVIAGEALGIKSPVYTITPTTYLQFSMEPGATLEQQLPPSYNVFLYTLSGTLLVGPDKRAVEAHHTVTLTRSDDADGILLQAPPGSAAEFVLIGGQPHNEPIVQHGPFVMNSREQIMTTFKDYEMGTNGFEGARGWHAEIDERLHG